MTSSWHDLVIRGGLIADGTGGAPFIADVAVDDGVISCIGIVERSGQQEINAAGHLVTPGFVDIHTHYDGQAIWSDRLSPSSAHGVTTVVTGNCGVGFAPCRRQDHDLLVRVMEGVEDIPGVVMTAGLRWDWETFPEYLDAVAAKPRDIDIAAYLPHSPLRVYVMGQRGADREAATGEDLARMRALTRQAIEAGAIGIASSRLLMHRTKAGEQIPSFDAADAELSEIAAGMTDAASGVIQLVLNAPVAPWGSEMDHLVGVAERSGRPATFSMGTSNAGPRIWDEAMRRMQAANEAGTAIRAQVLPRPVGLLMGHELSTNPFVFCPAYQPLQQLSLNDRVARLRDPALRAILLRETPAEGTAFAAAARNWEWIFPFTDPPNYEPSRDQSVAALAAVRGVTAEAFAYDYLLEQDGHAMLYNTLGNFYEGRLDAVYDLMRRPDVVVGLGDGGAHYAAICDASYPTFLLTYWVRDRNGPRLAIGEAVRILSREPAAAVGLLDRGLLRAGYKADINIIDLDHLTLHGPVVRYDLPAGGKRLDQTASGYAATIVSGKIIQRNDQPTGQLPGRLVRGAQAPPVAMAEV